MRPLRAPRATIVPVPALVDGKMAVGPKTGVDPKVDAVRKMDAVPKMGAALKMGAVPKVVEVTKAVRSQEWSSLSVRQFPAARLTRRGSHLQAFQFGRLRLQSQDHVAVLVAKAPMVPAADLADQVAPAEAPAEDPAVQAAVQAAVRLHVVIANRATCANRVRHTSKFFTSSACFSM